jgi:hypothetical protein
MTVGYMEKRMNLCFGFPSYIDRAFIDPALSGLQANMRHGLISQILLMDQIGLLVLYLNRIDCMQDSLTVVLLCQTPENLMLNERDVKCQGFDSFSWPECISGTV